MAKEKIWNFQTEDGATMEVVLRKNTWISVNGKEEINARDIKDGSVSNIFENVFNIPLPNGEQAKLFVGTKHKLVYQGKDVNTGLPYEAVTIPKWTYVFFVLFALNFLIIMGGALGAVASISGAYAVHHVACRTEKSNAVKVGLCIAIYVAITIISTFIVGLLYF